MNITELSPINPAMSFLCSAPIAVAIVAPTGRVSYANPTLETMFGYTAGELDGQLVELLLPERYQDAHRGPRRPAQRWQ
jgi:PAS domain S-box-containing protein